MARSASQVKMDMALRWTRGQPDCDECNGTGLIPPGTRAVRVCLCVGMVPKRLEEMCQQLAHYIKRVQPDWAENMERTRDERHWTYTQLLSACMAYVYERGLHMTIPKHDFWKEGDEPEEVTHCALESCGKEFKRKYPGEAFCSQLCGQLAMAPKKPKTQQTEVENIQKFGVLEDELRALKQDESPFPIHDEHDQLADG